MKISTGVALDEEMIGQQVIGWVRVHQAEGTLSVVVKLCYKLDGHCHGSFMNTDLHASTGEDDYRHILRTGAENTKILLEKRLSLYF